MPTAYMGLTFGGGGGRGGFLLQYYFCYMEDGLVYDGDGDGELKREILG